MKALLEKTIFSTSLGEDDERILERTDACARGKPDGSHCRYGFSHKLGAYEDGLLLEKCDRGGGLNEIFRRNDVLVGSYEPDVLLANVGNVDWHPMLNLCGVFEYVTRYAMKAPRSTKAVLVKYALCEDVDEFGEYNLDENARSDADDFGWAAELQRVGARISLTRNLCVEFGYFNGFNGDFAEVVEGRVNSIAACRWERLGCADHSGGYDIMMSGDDVDAFPLGDECVYNDGCKEAALSMEPTSVCDEFRDSGNILAVINGCKRRKVGHRW